jgi:hypothetical protein
VIKYGIPIASKHLEGLRRLIAVLTTTAGPEALSKNYEVTERGEIMVGFKMIIKASATFLEW